jgi:hypothetical protein
MLMNLRPTHCLAALVSLTLITTIVTRPATANPANSPAATKIAQPKIALLQQRPDLIGVGINRVWQTSGSPIVAQSLQAQLRQMPLMSGAQIQAVNVNLRDMTIVAVTPGEKPNQFHVRLAIANNEGVLNEGVLTIASPAAASVSSIRVLHQMTINLRLETDPASNQARVSQINLLISDFRIRGTNLSGPLLQAMVNFFDQDTLSRGVEADLRQNPELITQLATAIQSDLDRIALPVSLQP